MAYSKFTLKKVRDDFGLTLVEGDRFFPTIAPIVTADYLTEFLQESIPLAVGTELEGTIVTLDLTEYSLNPVGQILGTLLWMATIG